MPNKTSPKAQQSAPKIPDTAVKRLPFAFPFLRRGQGNGATVGKFSDENEILKLLAEKEPSGSFLVSGKGMWHGGIHVSEDGAGRSLDLDSGVRCIADGHVIAYRIDRTYPVSAVTAHDGKPAFSAPYSTGFALIRHSMEFPKGTTLTFFSLYMHLQAYDDYARYPKRQKPKYWPIRFEVTEFAQDTPDAGVNGRTASAAQKGIRVRASAPRGKVKGILPQGASVSIGQLQHGYGQIADVHGASLHAPIAGGFVQLTEAIGGWIFLGDEHGGRVVREVMPDSSFDRVVALTSSEDVLPDGAPNLGFPIKAGELIGHLGRFDSLNQPAVGTRIVHIEVFCDDGIKSFIEQGRTWVKDHAPHKEDWALLKLSADPVILRIDRQTKLYKSPKEEGAEAPKTDVIQVYTFGELARDKERKYTEAQADGNGRKVNWWRVDGMNSLRQPIDGWVREQNFAGGRVTREFAQKWVDFLPLEAAHDPAHTMFATTKAYVDYSMQADVPNTGSLNRLSPLMRDVYRSTFVTGDGTRAADDLCNAVGSHAGAYSWVTQRMSRLIVKHESEWANPDKWKQLILEIEKETGPRPQHSEEQKRIEKLVWWDEVKALVPDFPAPDVFHVHPIGLVGNFSCQPQLIYLELLAAVNPSGTESYHLEILPALNKYAEGYLVNTPKRIAHFLSQIAVESSFKNVEENLSYSSKRMKEIFGCKPRPKGSTERVFSQVADDVLCSFGRLRDRLWTHSELYDKSPQNLANYVYENRYGNGAEITGDGYKYRGRGLIQTTFKANYEALSKEHNSRFPNDIRDFVENPDLLLSELQYGIESAFVYWAVTRNINSIADVGDVRAVTKAVNGGQNALNERRIAYNSVAPLLCLPLDVA